MCVCLCEWVSLYMCTCARVCMFVHYARCTSIRCDVRTCSRVAECVASVQGFSDEYFENNE